MDRVRQIADAVLYEGYVLWPYRKSALKNRQRFGFGTVYPPGGDDPPFMQAECLLEAGDDARVAVTVRCLHLVDRRVYRDGEAVDELELGGQLHLSWEEAVEREVQARAGLRSATSVPVAVEDGSAREELGDGCAVERSWRGLRGSVQITPQPLDAGLYRLTVRVENTTASPAAEREAHAFRSAHAVLTTSQGAFVSLTDPPAPLRAHAEACQNVGTWPVLAGEEGDRSTLLCSPIILPDHPEIAPESPGDLFDAGEIDQMLVLNILALTEEEKREMRASDPRTREILERTEALTEEQRMRLHGTIREFGLARHQ